MNLALDKFLVSPAGDSYAQSRLEAAPTFLLAGSLERLPAAIVELAVEIYSRQFFGRGGAIPSANRKYFP